ncbi:MAG: MBL fold metallo-hydrolase [Terrimonas sp.]|nr:MBL fold metallo-hydrolase [Terrimonas sp.]
MSLEITALNSGSNGNCYYIGNDDEAILIDAGISCREVERRMARLGLEMKKLKAVFISHEHTDHISGLPVLSKKYQLPVYISSKTEKAARLKLDKKWVHHFETDDCIKIGGISVLAFKKNHDAADPHSFVASSSTVTIGVFTDIGIACKKVIQYFKQCHAVFLESNYDTVMLMQGNYPFHLKKRISDGKGHISNEQALDLFLSHRPKQLSHLILSHLSQNNNKPELVERLFAPHGKGINIIVASRYRETAVYKIEAKYGPRPKLKSIHDQKALQLKLF